MIRPATHHDLPHCRFCSAPLQRTFVDLGMSPLCESYISHNQAHEMEPFYPLHVYVCDQCFLVQLESFVSPEQLFNDYGYFSSSSESWVAHARDYSQQMIERFGLCADQRVIEIASNDGYLLQHFVAQGIPSLGIEPATNVARAAIDKGITTLIKFFGVATAKELVAQGCQADLLIGNNILGQVPALNDFVAGMKLLLDPQGVITMEFPHLMRLMAENQFDTIYHEHISYFSFITANRLFESHGLMMFDVEELPTHGGSLRIYACHDDDTSKFVNERVHEMIFREVSAGFDSVQRYAAFDEQVKEAKRKLLAFLIKAKRDGKTVVAYGAPGKGNTLLNYCGIRSDFVDFTVDRNPSKQGKFLPGSHIPILHPDAIQETKPHYVLILPWSNRSEIMEQVKYIRAWGGRFVVPIPEARVYE